jgi:sugar/nucleoside kinase (ribokinase family)
MSAPRLLAIGGAHLDRRGRSHARFVAGASNPGTMREEAGGAVFNTLRTALCLGISGAIMSARGGDLAGERVARAIAAAGADDLSSVHLDRVTPSYTALIDHDGALIGALADMALYETAFGRIAARSATRRAIAAADAVLVDANLPPTALDRIVALALAAGKPVFANATSPAKAPRLAPVLPRLACLFANRGEAARLAGQPPESGAAVLIDGLRRQGVRRAIVTHGGDPLVGFGTDGVFLIEPPAAGVRDVTGAGDALAGAAIAAMMRGLPLCEAARHGAAAAALVIGSEEAAPAFTRAAFRRMLGHVGRVAALEADRREGGTP